MVPKGEARAESRLMFEKPSRQPVVAAMLTADTSQKIAAVLGLVFLSSLSLLVFGLKPQRSPFEFLHVPTALAQLAFICVVVLKADWKQQLITMPRPQRALLAALFVYVFFVSMASPIPAALLLAVFWLIHIAFFVALIIFYRASFIHESDMIWRVLGIAALGHVAAFLVAWAIWPELVRDHILPVFENIRFLGYFVAPAAGVTAMLYVTRSGGAFLTMLSFSAAAFYIIHTGSRGGAVAIVAGLCVAAAYLAWHRRRVLGGRAVVLLAVTVALLVISGFLPNLPWPPLFDRAVADVSNPGLGALSGRDWVWSVSADAIKENWLIGYGPAFLVHIYILVLDGAEVSVRNSHNIVLQFLLHWGVLGSALIFATGMSFARNIWTALTIKTDHALLPLVALVTMLVHSLVSGVFFYPYSTVIAIVAFACLDRVGWQEQRSRSAGTD